MVRFRVEAWEEESMKPMYCDECRRPLHTWAERVRHLCFTCLYGRFPR